MARARSFWVGKTTSAITTTNVPNKCDVLKVNQISPTCAMQLKHCDDFRTSVGELVLLLPHLLLKFFRFVSTLLVEFCYDGTCCLFNDQTL